MSTWEFLSTCREGRVLVKLFVQPKARKNQVVGNYDGRLKIAISAPPVDGKANKEMISFLAKHLGLRKKQIEIISGDHSRKKDCLIHDVREQELREKLTKLL